MQRRNPLDERIAHHLAQALNAWKSQDDRQGEHDERFRCGIDVALSVLYERSKQREE